MRLSTFITDNLEQIIREWETFATTLLPAAASMTRVQLRDHSKQILQAIATDIEAPQSERQRMEKSRELMGARTETAAATHGALRHEVGFDLEQLSAEFRALRASVLRLWMMDTPSSEAFAFDDMLRFNEAVDQALAESIARYAQEMERSRNIFLAILGHDLRTPLGAITTIAQQLRLPQPERKQVEALARIERSASTMGGMIRDLLDFTRSRLGNGIPVSLRPTDLEAVCMAALDEVRGAYPQCKSSMEADGEFLIQADADRLGQLLWNLLSNAAQYGAQDFPVVLTLHGERERVVLQVKNRGRAIPPAALRVIFNPMVRRAENDGAGTAATNLGLGLFIAREITRAHGGNISAASSEERGTVFTVSLPRHQRERQA